MFDIWMRKLPAIKDLLPGHLALAAAIYFCAAIADAGPAAAWGRAGHRVIVDLAEQHLTPEATREVTRLLALEDSTRMSDVVMWADQIRRQNIPGTPDHDVPVPFDAEHYDAARDCQSRCAAGAITFYLQALVDRTKPDAERLEALKYVIHLVGDIHQPLHVAQDGGGQLVVWAEKTVYLHILWDVTILATSHPTPEALTAAVSERLRPSPSCGTVEEWTNESHNITRTFVYPALGPQHPQPITIPAEYARTALSIIEERVALAAMRLSCVLNTALVPRPAGGG